MVIIVTTTIIIIIIICRIREIYGVEKLFLHTFCMLLFVPVMLFVKFIILFPSNSLYG